MGTSERTLKKWRREALKIREKFPQAESYRLPALTQQENNRRMLIMTLELIDNHLMKSNKDS